MKKHKNKKSFLLKFRWIFFLLCFSAFGAEAQEVVKGLVTDVNEEPLIGVNIRVKGTDVGTITNIEGRYSIEVSGDNAVLVFTYIGFKTEEKAVGGESNIDVVLSEDTKMVDELVVVAYGTQLKSHLTGAVSSLKNKNLDEIPVVRVDQALQGKLAGVQIQNLSTEAGADPVIRVRGMGSISARQEPLVVVDGFPIEGGLSMVNMGDVESIEVLKDAASSALYGSRAAGGVILVTTKSGDMKKTKYSFKMFTGMRTPLELPDMMSTEEYVELLYEEAALRELDPSVDGTDATLPFNRVTNNERAAYLISKHLVDEPTDWVDEGMRDFAGLNNYQLSASGGNKSIRYYLSGNYSSEDGIMKKSSYDKYSFKTKLDIDLSERVSIGVNFNPTYSKKERPAVNLTDFMRFPSWMPVYHNEATAEMAGNRIAGDFAQVPDFAAASISGEGIGGEIWHIDGVNPWSSGNQTPVSIRERTDIFEDYYRMLTNAYMAIKILPGLEFKTSNGVYLSYKEYNEYEQSEANKAGLPNKLTRQARTITDLLSENILNYNRRIGDHDIGGLAGFTVQKSTDNYNQIIGTGFPDEERLSFNMASSILMNTSSQDGVRSYYYGDALMSFIGRLNYVYQDKYLLSASLRADGSSKFYTDHKWGTFPSGSIGWRVSEEGFMKESDVISNLKLRASYGVNGNNDIEQYAYLNKIQSLSYVTGTNNGSLIPGMSSTDATLGNDEITWEQLAETNIGLDLGFINNRFNLSVEYYNSNTIQLLLRQPAMYITGHQNFWNNIGEVNNKGLEIEITTANIDKKNFSWSTTANLSTNKNTLLNYGNKEMEDQTGERSEVYRNEVGKESIQFFGYQTDGVYSTFEEVEEAYAMVDENGDPFVWAVYKPIIGGLKVVNTNGDNRLDPEDRVVIGSPFPDFIWGINNEFKYRNFDFSFLFQGSQGGELRNGNIYYNEQLRMNRAYTENRFVSPAYPGDGMTVYSTTTPGIQILSTDYAVEDASYASLRTLTFGYTLPKKITKAIGIHFARAYFSGQNLLYFMGSDYRGVNPEARSTSGKYDNPLISGYQRGVYPLYKTYTFGLDITF